VHPPGGTVDCGDPVFDVVRSPREDRLRPRLSHLGHILREDGVDPVRSLGLVALQSGQLKPVLVEAQDVALRIGRLRDL
jgi:hypothetical protein